MQLSPIPNDKKVTRNFKTWLTLQMVNECVLGISAQPSGLDMLSAAHTKNVNRSSKASYFSPCVRVEHNNFYGGIRYNQT